jgi:hypothetical protein
MALELGANFYHQLRWVQCIVPQSYSFYDAMDYLAERDDHTPFE